MQAPAIDRPTSASWTTSFITRLHRYKALLLRRWWIPLLTICLGLFVQAWLIYQTPPSFVCTSHINLAGQQKKAPAARDSEEPKNL